MVIEPKIINSICITAHPVGLEAVTKRQIEWTKNQPKIDMPKRVLVLGGSTGYGLSTRITAAFAGGADTLCVSFEKEPAKRAASPGFYNNRMFDKEAQALGLKAESINADAFSHETRKVVIAKIKELFEGGQVDLVVYSLASPVRVDPDTGEMYKSVIKPIGNAFKGKTINVVREEVVAAEIPACEEAEIEPTIKVMGGEDWKIWIDAMLEAGVLAEGVKTTAYSYHGPHITHNIYWDGTIGQAKKHLKKTSDELEKKLKSALGGESFVAVNKALVTRSSSVIPVVPLYITLLFKIMKEKGTHEGCMEQMYRMLAHKVYKTGMAERDDADLVRMDDWEMDQAVQDEIMKYWEQIETSNLKELTDLAGFHKDYMELHGFEVEGVDYSADVDIN
ncbi:MAG: trans-2-enoyl-CoA reductase family protein [Spirochaetaceae bacterium]|jgi:enoyl-[acyl-carrier protein] reductase/trans-2-enoyl-CoA reductase (NAD+)|nr:trans-2-enoyl-CoA reductase family protein [Spirochaetaceae bacterium]